jgi:serine/threonine-protein kinase RsbW
MRWPVDMKFSLALPREALSVPVIRKVLGDALRGLGVSQDCIADILVAASEACTNVIEHAETASDFEVAAFIDDDNCVLKIVDNGRGFRDVPTRQSGPDDESGRGIKIMRALLDGVDFDSRPGHGTAVYLHKRLTWREEAPIRRLERELVHSAR